jgi:hypothetical protein
MSAGTPIPPNQPIPGYQNYPPQRPPQYPPQRPPSSGNTVLKIVLIVIGVFVVLGVLVAGVIGFVGYRVAKSAHQNADGSVSFSTPNGTITTGKSANISAADLGTEPYPGATSSVGSMNMKTSSGSMVTAVYTSPDPADKIVAFYKEKLGDEASVVQTGHGATLTAGEKNKNQITVSVSAQGDLTKIAIIHITSTK